MQIVQKFLCPSEDMLCSAAAVKDNSYIDFFGDSGRAEFQHRKQLLSLVLMGCYTNRTDRGRQIASLIWLRWKWRPFESIIYLDKTSALMNSQPVRLVYIKILNDLLSVKSTAYKFSSMRFITISIMWEKVSGTCLLNHRIIESENDRMKETLKII